MMQQILEYQTVLYAKHKKPVIPIVVHQGAKKLKKSLQFQDTLRDMTPTVRRHFGGIALNFTCLPVDIQRLDWKDRDLTAGPIFYIMSQARRMSLRTLGEFARLCKRIGNRRIRDVLLDEGLGYFNRCDPEKFSWGRMGEVITKNFDEGDKIMRKMTFGQEMAREDGREEGRERGREERDKEIALQMLEKGMDTATICECTGLTEKQVESLMLKQAA